MITFRDPGGITTHPKYFYLGVSGGVDSMAAYDFLRRGKKTVIPLFVDHGTQTSREAQGFLLGRIGLPLAYKQIKNINRPKGKSWEEHWRDERQEIFRGMGRPVLTAHHLDDVVETYLWGVFHGSMMMPEYYNGSVYRPFLLTPKAEFVDWAKRHGVEWIEDQTNQDCKYVRNRIRNRILPEVLKVNPGISKVVRRMLQERDEGKPNPFLEL